MKPPSSSVDDIFGMSPCRRAAIRLCQSLFQAMTYKVGVLWSGVTDMSSRSRLPGLLAGVCFGLALAGAAEPDAFQRAKEELPKLDVPALLRAVEDLQASYPGKYHDGAAMLEGVRAFEKDLPSLAKGLESRDKDALARYSALVALRQKALLANPLLDFEQMLVLRRREDNLGLPQNWQGNSSLNPHVENELCRTPVQGPERHLKTFYKPSKNYFVGDVDLNYDADKLLFSSIGSHNRWQVFEIRMDGTGLRQVTPSDEPDIDSYDAVYLPDNRIIFDSTSTFEGVPCVGGSDYVANLHLMNPDGTNIRRLCFDQDNDWYPVVIPSGRVMYLRWEYTDSAHYFSRVLMSMNPDGTSQASVYHNNKYWPNGLWYARPLPGHPTKFVAIISGRKNPKESSPGTMAFRGWARWCSSTWPRGGRRTLGRSSASRATASRSRVSSRIPWWTIRGRSSCIRIR